MNLLLLPVFYTALLLALHIPSGRSGVLSDDYDAYETRNTLPKPKSGALASSIISKVFSLNSRIQIQRSSHGEPCSASKECSDSFVCTNGLCNCPHPKHETYDVGQKKCLSIIHGTCSTDSDCVPNSNCTLHPEIILKVCACKTGFVENVNGTCELAFGSSCDYAPGSLPCDTFGELECRNNTCACEDPFTLYVPDRRACLGLIGSRCKAVNSYDSDCVDNASCVRISNLKKKFIMPGTCQCNDGFRTVTKTRVCERLNPSSTPVSTNASTTTRARATLPCLTG
jgi:hypothetical protein